jgi:pimeloyl-ACP methyl ester carboxylesterase
MIPAEVQHRLAAAGALALLLLAAPAGAQDAAGGIRAPVTASQVVYTGPIAATSGGAAGSTDIRPFRVQIPDAALADMRRRIAETRWPDRETVTDHSQGVPLAPLRELARHWATDYDWRRVEARLNALPQFVTNIDGLDIHFIHVRSKHANALPIVVSHGWPGSIIEQIKLIGPLTDPTAHGGTAEDAFHVVIPSMPGYGFSGRPQGTGHGVEWMAGAWDVLMKRLGYTRYVAQGGDWGAFVVDRMGVQAPAGLLAIHTNYPGTVPADVDRALVAGDPPPAGLSDGDYWATREDLGGMYGIRSGYQASFPGVVPLYRLRYPPNGDIYFTADETEKNQIVAGGWQVQRIIAYVWR